MVAADEFSLQRSVSRYRMKLANVEKEILWFSDLPIRIYPVLVVLCLSAFAHREDHTQDDWGTHKVENERRHGACLSGSGPKGC